MLLVELCGREPEAMETSGNDSEENRGLGIWRSPDATTENGTYATQSTRREKGKGKALDEVSVLSEHRFFRGGRIRASSTRTLLSTDVLELPLVQSYSKDRFRGGRVGPKRQGGSHRLTSTNFETRSVPFCLLNERVS